MKVVVRQSIVEAKHTFTFLIIDPDRKNSIPFHFVVLRKEQRRPACGEEIETKVVQRSHT